MTYWLDEISTVRDSTRRTYHGSRVRLNATLFALVVMLQDGTTVHVLELVGDGAAPLRLSHALGESDDLRLEVGDPEEVVGQVRPMQRPVSQ